MPGRKFTNGRKRRGGGLIAHLLLEIQFLYLLSLGFNHSHRLTRFFICQFKFSYFLTMPFINDVVKSNQENLAKAKANSTPRLSRFLFKPENVIKNLSNQIIGQKQVIHAVGDVLQVIKADFGSESRPLSVMMFLGPTGVGKTETVKVLTESILGDANK